MLSPISALALLKSQDGVVGVIIQGNTIQAISPVYIPKFKSLSVLAQRIIICESGGRHYDEKGNIIRGKSGEIGIAQFTIKTWQWMNKLRGTNLDITKEEDQLDMLEWAIKNNLIHHWTCYRKIRRVGN